MIFRSPRVSARARLFRRSAAALCAGAALGAARAGERLDRALDEMDRIQAEWAGGLLNTVERFDRFFGDERFDAEGRETRLAVVLGVYADRRDGAKIQNRFRARLSLPNLQKRVLLFIEDAFETERADRPAELEDAARESKPVTGLRLAAESVGKARLTADLGLRLGGDPQIVARTRLSFARVFEAWERRWIQTLSWYSADGFAAGSELRWTRDLGRGRLFRSATAIGWRADESGVTPAQSFSWFLSRRDGGGHRWTVRAAWPETPGCERAVYAAEYVWRRRLHRDWLFLELGPGLDFRQEDDYEPNPFGVLRIEVNFERP